MAISIETMASATDEVRDLLSELDHALTGPYAADQQHALSFGELFQPSVRFFLARLDGSAAGCAGVALLGDYAELKRMYCRPFARGRGVAQALLGEIEAATRDAGLAVLRLETGVFQHAAIKFYHRSGFRARAPFGPYAQMRPRAIERSAFYEKAV